jgi:hypothetical protein
MSSKCQKRTFKEFGFLKEKPRDIARGFII